MAGRGAGMLSVGEIARRTGLTTKALRHCDHLGLLSPRAVSKDGYRWYGEDQVVQAGRVAPLRALDMPLDAVRACLAGADESAVRRLLQAHRALALAAGIADEEDMKIVLGDIDTLPRP